MPIRWVHRRRLFGRLLAIAGTLIAQSALATGLQITAENDSVVTAGDRHYTQGARIALQPYRLAASDARAGTDGALWLQWQLVGQQLYTPDHVGRPKPDPTDRPYAGWLYTGAALFSVGAQHYERYETLVGIVGPSAGGEALQNGFHHVFGYPTSAGWRYQLSDTPVVVATVDRGDRLVLSRLGGQQLAVISQLGLTAGNLFDQVHAAALLRLGTLDAFAYGPDQLRGSYSGLPQLGATPEPFGRWALWAGVYGQAVFYNRLLQGNGGDSPHVPHEPLVHDWMIGGAIALPRRWQLEVHALDRSNEFRGQQGHDRMFGFSLCSPWP